MRCMLSLLALACVVAAGPSPSLPVNPGGIGGLFKGPNSEIIIKGPDGSVITSEAEGGEVHTNLKPIVAAEPVLVDVSAKIPVTLPSIAIAIPEIAPAPVVETVAVAVPDIEPEQSADIHGSSGRIVTQGSKAIIAGPASTTISGPRIVAQTFVKGPSVIASPIPVAPAIGATVLTASPPLNNIPIVGTAFTSVTAAPVLGLAESIPSGIVSVTASPLTLSSTPIAPHSGTEEVIHGGLVSDLTLRRSDEELRAPELSRGIVSTDRIVSGDVISSSTYASLPSGSGITVAPPLLPLASQSNLETLSVSTHHPATLSATHNLPPTISSLATPLPLLPSTSGPLVNNNGVSGISGNLNPNVFPSKTNTINNQISLTSLHNTPQLEIHQINQLAQEQLLNGRQLRINPALIHSSNIIPPEIGLAKAPELVTNQIISTTIETPRAPGLGSIVSIPPIIQRSEIDEAIVTPNNEISRVATVTTKNEIVIPQNQAVTPQDPRLVELSQDHRLLIGISQDPRVVGSAQDPRLIGLSQDPRLVGPSHNPILVEPSQNPRLVGSSQNSRLIGLSQDPRLIETSHDPSLIGPSQDSRFVELSQDPGLIQHGRLTVPSPLGGVVGVAGREQILLGQSTQIPVEEAVRNNIPEASRLFTPAVVNVTPRTDGLILSQRAPTLASVQQQELLSSELAKAGIDASQVQLTNVPLSAVSPIQSRVGPITFSSIGNDQIKPALSWNRFQRDSSKSKRKN